MENNVYYVACASAIIFVIWKVIEKKYVRKTDIVLKSTVIDAISVFVSVVAGAYTTSSVLSKTTHVVGVFTNEPGF